MVGSVGQVTENYGCYSQIEAFRMFLVLSRHTLFFPLGNKVPMIEKGVMECNDQRTPPNLRANCIVPCSHGISKEKCFHLPKKHQRGAQGTLFF